MLDIFSGLRLVVKRRSISIDNAIFRCHWFFTSTLLVSFSLVITARQYVGQPIECHSVNKIPDSLLNSYCWVQSTFSVPQACNQQVGTEVPYPCIDNTRGREIKVFAYYQWVGMVLFIQGLMFHLPYYLWKVWENGLIRAITGGLRVAVLSDQEREKKKEIVVEYIHNHLGCHKQYAIKYFLCEFICLINLLAQLWATNRFFDGQFLRYGLSVMQYSSGALGLASSSANSAPSFNQTATLPISPLIGASRNLIQPVQLQQQQQQPRQQQAVDPMTFIFPRITKCTYYDFGSSGDVQKHDALCLLPLNIINEKIYIALWFWFLVLALLTLLVIIYRLLAISSEQVRCKGLLSRCKLSNELDIRIICRHCDVGDWFLFYMVAENLDPLIMREIVNDIANKIRAHFELKRELSMLHGDNEADRDSMYKYRPPAVDFRWRYRGTTGSQSFDESAASTRRNSLADEMPLVRKLKKRLHPKRLWSVDMGSSGPQPSNQQQQQQPMPQLNSELPRPTAPIMRGRQSITSSGTVSVGAPVSPGELESAPPPPPPPPQAQSSQQAHHHDQPRRAELTRAASTTSSTASTATVESYVMEMQPMSGPSAELCASRLERRKSSHGQRPPLLRQRNSQSIASIRDLRLNHSPATTVGAAAAAAGLEP